MSSSKWEVWGYGFGVHSVHYSARAAWYAAWHAHRFARHTGDPERKITVTQTFGGYQSYTLTA